MNIEDLISQYLDGELSPDAEAEMHYKLSLSAEARTLFREHMALHGAAHDRRLLLQPTQEMRSSLFSRLEREGMNRATAGDAAALPDAVLRPAMEPLSSGASTMLPRSGNGLLRWGVPILCVAVATAIFSWVGPRQAPTMPVSDRMATASARPHTDAPAADVMHDRSHAGTGSEAASPGLADMGSSDIQGRAGVPVPPPGRSSAIGNGGFRGRARMPVESGLHGHLQMPVENGTGSTSQDPGAMQTSGAPSAPIADTSAMTHSASVAPPQVVETPRQAEPPHVQEQDVEHSAHMAAVVDSLNLMLRAHARESLEHAQEQGDYLVPFVSAQAGLLGGGAGMPGADYSLRVGVEFPGGNHQLYAMFGSSGVRITDRTIISGIILHDTSGTVPVATPAAQVSDIVQRDLWYGVGYRYSIPLMEHLSMGGAVEGGIGGHYFRLGAAVPFSYALDGVLRMEFSPKLQYVSAIGETITTSSALVDATPHIIEKQERTQALTTVSSFRPGAEFGVTFLFR